MMCQAIDFSNLNIRLSKSYSKLHTLHPSDLADILEDLGKKSSMSFSPLSMKKKAADVLEELETNAQIHIVETFLSTRRQMFLKRCRLMSGRYSR